MYFRISVVCLFGILLSIAKATELTFELEDNARQCFHEIVKKGIKTTLEYQVISGGQYDVDVIMTGPNGNTIYDERKKQYDSHTFTAEKDGEYVFCFSNEFSTFTHKVIYFDFQAGDEEPKWKSIGGENTALTSLEMSSVTMHESLKVVVDYQTHHRLREAQARDRAEYLNERVQYWSIGESVLIVILSIGQVFVLRRFFAEKRSNI